MRLPFGITITRDTPAPVAAPEATPEPAALPARIANETTTSNGTVVVESSDAVGMREIFGVDASSTGIVVTPERSMRVAAVSACARLIAGALAMMPIKFYRSKGAGEYDPAPDHPLRWLFNEAADDAYTSASWMELMAASVMLYGDGFTPILRDRNGGIAGLMPLLPWQSNPRYLPDGSRFYACIDNKGKSFGVDPADMLHFTGFGFNGLRSMSVIQHAGREAIGIALAADQFSGAFYANGAQSPYALTHPGDLSPEQIQRLRDNWTERYTGIANGRRPIILTNGVTVTELNISAEDAQLLEARKFQVVDIARAFGVPPSMIGETEKVSSWGSGVEHMTLAFIVFTLGPYITRFEQEFNRKLFKTDTYIARFNTKALMRLDALARAKYYREAMGGSQGPGWMTANEIRHEDDLPPIEGGDTRYELQPSQPKERAANGNEESSAVDARQPA